MPIVQADRRMTQCCPPGRVSQPHAQVHLAPVEMQQVAVVMVLVDQNRKLPTSLSWPENQGILFFYISKTLQMIRISFMASLLNAVL